MNYKKVFKRETKVIVYVVICLTLIVIGTSYALFLQVGNNSTNQVVEAGTLKITYSNGNTVSINNSNDETNCLYPQSDNTGSSSGGCIFTLSIQNTGTLPAEYNLLIYDNKEGNNDLVDQTFVRHSLKKKIGSENVNVVNEASSISSLGSYQSSDKRILETSTIQPNEIIVFTLNIWIDENASTDIIGKTVALKLDVVGTVYENDKEENPNPVAQAKCKRATTLHTEICNPYDYACEAMAGGNGTYKNGDTITYGNIGTEGILNTGDAFDCDINGDGVYDSSNERFYYVSDLANSDNRVAVLVYYNNYGTGTYDSSGSNANGPITAKEKLPLKSIWTNVQLSNNIRNILDEHGNVIKEDFNYEGYAARLLSAKEIFDVCSPILNNDKSYSLNKSCEFLLENTGYANNYNGDYHNYLLESPAPDTIDALNSAWMINPMHITMAPGGYNAYIRPVIEIYKSDIDY